MASGNPLFSRFYVRYSRRMEGQGVGEHRRRLLAGVAGRVVEVGAGNGLNFAHYPPGVTEVVAVEPEPTLRAAAVDAAAGAPVPVTVVDGVVDALPLDDGSVDAAVASLVLCSVPDQARALAEVRRVLRPGGELRFYEHVASRRPTEARVQRVLDATVWPRMFGGCHTHRDTARAIEQAGFEVRELDRFAFSPGRFAPPAPHILGVATA